MACSDRKITYEFLVFRDNNIKMWTATVDELAGKEIENGDFVVDTPEKDIVSKGKFNKGLRYDEWVYHPYDTQTVKVVWTKYVSENDDGEINYPVGWEIHESKSRPFQASFPVESEILDDKYFIILQQFKDSIKMDLNSYWNLYNTKAFNAQQVEEYALFKLETVNAKVFYFSRYIIKRGEEKILMLNFLGERESKIYDITYSSLTTEYEKKHIIFFDIRSLILEKKRFFSPYDPIKKFQQIEKPKDKADPTVIS